MGKTQNAKRKTQNAKRKTQTQTQSQKETSKFLNKDVLAVGIFDVSLTAGQRNVAPAAAGLAAGLITKHVQKKIINKDDDKEYSMKNRMLTGAIGLATAAGTQQIMKHHDANKNGLTPIMIGAVTKHKVYLLDWKGTHNMGKGPTETLFEFSRSKAMIKNHTRKLVHHTVEIKEDGNHVKIECDLGATHSNKKMNREVVNLLKQWN